MHHLYRRMAAACLGLLACAVATAALAGHGPCQKCPQCDNKVCVPTPETKKVKKHCWDVECEDICIPAIRWPWQSSCSPPSCGKVKTVKVLKKVEYECEECGYTWDIKTVGCSCHGGCDACTK